MRIIKIARKFLSDLRRSLYSIDSDMHIKYLRKKGVKIGEGCKFPPADSMTIDLTRPYLISIGNNVRLTQGVTILTHGFDWFVLREIYKRPFGSAGKVIIGDNVFIGMNSTILKGVTIGNNVIIGASSLVTKNIPDNTVAFGFPAKAICSIEEYYNKRIDKELEEASIVANGIISRYNRLPNPQDFKEFFYLYLKRDEKFFGSLPVERQAGKYYTEFMQSKPKFSSFDLFLDKILNIENTEK